MKLKKYLAKGLALGIIISNVPFHSFANSIENQYYNELNNIETKEDLQKSGQKAVTEGKVDTWIEGLATMPTARDSLTSSVVNGKIYVIGGKKDSSYKTLETYDPITDQWETKTSMPTARYGLTGSVVNGKIYVIGGYETPSTIKNTVEVYDPTTNTWDTKTNMPTARYGLTSSVIGDKIYVMGGCDNYYYYSNKVEVYDTSTDSWETKTNMPTSREYLTSNIVDNKIYCIGGYNGSSYLNSIEVYDPSTDKWETKTPMPTARGYLTSSVVENKIYCIGGYKSSSYLNSIEVYDPSTDKWETKTPMPTARGYLTSSVVGNKIYCIGGHDSSSYLNKVEVYIATGPSLEEQATSSVSNAELSKDLLDIETARELVNQLEEGELKTQLQARLDAIIPNLSLVPINVTSSVDTYITTENILSMTLDTNTIIFEDFSGIEDMDKPNAINVTVSSSLPYQLNVYLPVEIQNSDKTKTMDKSILNIKENSELEYKTFTNINEKVILKDNCIAGDYIKHGIDLKLKSGITHEKDVYKATIKLEVEQK